MSSYLSNLKLSVPLWARNVFLAKLRIKENTKKMNLNHSFRTAILLARDTLCVLGEGEKLAICFAEVNLHKVIIPPLLQNCQFSDKRYDWHS